MRPVPRRILCATDLSDGSPELFSYAVSKARENDAGILVLHVVSRWAVWKGRIGALWAGVPFNKRWARIKWDTCEKMKDRMAQFFARHRQDGLVLSNCFETRLVVHGKVAEEIAAKADLFQCDAIVVGCSRKGFWKPRRRNRLAKRLVRLSPRPIHTAPPPVSRFR
jgi:nucleotide-binding universal stress UspA family protein